MNRIITYKTKNILDSDNFTQAVQKIQGVVNCQFGNETIVYEIDEWASDYDIMLKVMEIAEKLGGEILFDDEEQTVGETEDLTEDLPEELKNPLGEDEEEVIDETTGETVKRKITKKGISDYALKGYEILFSLLTLVVYLFIQGSKFGDILLLVGFTVVGYEVIYSAITKITKKDYFNTPLFVIISSMLILFLSGEAICGVIITLSYTFSEWLGESLERRSKSIEKETDEIEIDEFNAYRENCKVSPSEKLTKTVKSYNIALLVLGVIVTFIPPLFNAKNYGYYLGIWAKKGATILLAVDLMEIVTAVSGIITDTHKKLFFSGLRLKSDKTLFDISKVKQVIFDYESLQDKNGVLAKDVSGAMQELKDLGIKREILLSEQTKDQTREIRKSLKMYNSFGEISKSNRNSKIAEILGKEKLPTIVLGETNYDNVVNVSYADNNSDVVITDKEISLFPYLYKLTKRCKKLSMLTVILSLLCKLSIIVLAIFTEVQLSVIGVIFGVSWILYGAISLLSQKRVD